MEKDLRNYEYLLGLDEVGRGAFAGPIVVGAVLIEAKLEKSLINEICLSCNIGSVRDSKKMSRMARERVYNYLKNRVVWSVGVCSAKEIDYYKLSFAQKKAADRAISFLKISKRDGLLVQADAGLFHSKEDYFETKRYIRGDEKYLPIMLASIMAKVWRDSLMKKYSLEDKDCAGYGWEKNAGYGTKEHRNMIEKNGLTNQHRKLFCSTYLKKNAKLG